VSDREVDWATDGDGLAHDRDHWYVTNKKHLYRYAIDDTLRRNNYSARKSRSDLAPTCDHVGDPDVYRGELYVPMEGCHDGHARIVVLSTPELEVRRTAVLNVGHAAFVAVDPRTGLMAVMGNGRSARTLSMYPSDFFDQHSLTPAYVVTLEPPLGLLTTQPAGDYLNGDLMFPPLPVGWSRDGDPAAWSDAADDEALFNWIQGGAFSPSGRFYLVAENRDAAMHALEPGVFVYDLEGPVGIPVDVGGGRSSFPVDYDGESSITICYCLVACCRDYVSGELQGIDVWDTTAHPEWSGGIGGQIHLMKIDNDWPSDADGWIRHYTVTHPENL
jgi:hypothetical protein